MNFEPEHPAIDIIERIKAERNERSDHVVWHDLAQEAYVRHEGDALPNNIASEPEIKAPASLSRHEQI